MIGREVRERYTATIGIECHVQLKTQTKLFSSVGNDAREAPPNTLVSHIDFGLPGALPVLNEEAVKLTARAAFALGTVPQKFSKFDRKHYFYPDLPKGYQITQYDQPTVVGGAVEIVLPSGDKKIIGITRAHMEEDAGKNTHPAGKDYSLVDLNRAGTPLIEIVSEPDMHSSEEAKLYARELYLRMKYAGVSDANLYYGNMRFDVNVSVSQTKELGTRSETKNLNSFRAVEKAVDYEIARHIELLEKGGTVVQETRGWDDAKQKTFSQRTKENADDYRYMPEPDIPPIVLDNDFIESVRNTMPIMPAEWRTRLASLGVDKAATETLIEAEVEEGQVSYLPLIEMLLAQPDAARQTALWQINVEIPLRREKQLPQRLNNLDRLKMYGEIYTRFKDGKVSSTQAKDLLATFLEEAKLPEHIDEFIANKGFVQVSDEAEITKIVAKVLKENEKAAEDVRSGETKAIGFLVGQVMKQSQGKANPQLAQELIKKQLGI